MLHAKKKPRPTVRGPHPRPQQFLRIRYRFVNEAGYWFNVDNRNTFEHQFVGAMQFAGVILRDLDGFTWAWYVNDLNDESFFGQVHVVPSRAECALFLA